MRIFAYFILKEKTGKLPLDLFSRALMTSSKKVDLPQSLRCTKKVKTRKWSEFFKSKVGHVVLLRDTIVALRTLKRVMILSYFVTLNYGRSGPEQASPAPEARSILSAPT